MAFAPQVVIDVRMARHAGIGTYIRNVVPRLIALRPNWRFTLLAARETTPAIEWTGSRNATVVHCTSSIYSVAEQLELPWRTPRNANVFWSPHYNLPLLSTASLVVTVHDVAHLALTDIHGSTLRQLYARQMFGALRRRASAVIFDSKFTADEFERRMGAAPMPATIHLGVDESWRAPATGAPLHERPYLLFVGSVKPHKNLIGLLRAFQSLVGVIEHDLIIVGAHAGQRTVDNPALALGASLGQRVRFVDGASDAELKRFVSGATALILPSFYEGFGLPALEAMAAGCACIVSTAGSLPEVCGSAALYCDPAEPADIARCIGELLANAALRDALVAAGHERAAHFEWNVTTARTAAVLESVLENVTENTKQNARQNATDTMMSKST